MVSATRNAIYANRSVRVKDNWPVSNGKLALNSPLKDLSVHTPDWQIVDIHLVPVMVADRIEKCLVVVISQCNAAVLRTRTISCHNNNNNNMYTALVHCMLTVNLCHITRKWLVIMVLRNDCTLNAALHYRIILQSVLCLCSMCNPLYREMCTA